MRLSRQALVPEMLTGFNGLSSAGVVELLACLVVSGARLARRYCEYHRRVDDGERRVKPVPAARRRTVNSRRLTPARYRTLCTGPTNEFAGDPIRDFVPVLVARMAPGKICAPKRLVDHNERSVCASSYSQPSGNPDRQGRSPVQIIAGDDIVATRSATFLESARSVYNRPR